MFFTVVPLFNLKIEKGSCIPFGNGFVLQDVPGWLLNDEHTLADINRTDRDAVRAGRHALVAEYDADSIGMRDPEWKGKNPKSIQDLKFQSAMHRYIAIRRMFTIRSPKIIRPRQQSCTTYSPPFRENPVWEALRAMWAGLTMDPVDHRYPFFWMALEALFGPNDQGETTFRLCQRIAFFIAGGRLEIARDIFKKAKTCYSTRSKIVHGRWKDDPKIDAIMGDTESIARTALRRVIEASAALNTFMSRHRDGFLDDLVFSRPSIDE